MRKAIRQHLCPFVTAIAVTLLGLGVLVLGPARHAEAATGSQIFGGASSTVRQAECPSLNWNRLG